MTAEIQHNKAFISEMREILEKEQERLQKLLAGFTNTSENGEASTNFPDYGDDEDENAAEVSDYSNNLSLEAELEKELRDVVNSIERIENGTYGIDKYTGEPISEARLRARPTSTSSIASKKTLTQEM